LTGATTLDTRFSTPRGHGTFCFLVLARLMMMVVVVVVVVVVVAS